MEGDSGSSSMENFEAQPKFSNKENERLENAEPVAEYCNLETKLPGSDDSTKRSEKDRVVSELSTMTSEEPEKIRAIRILDEKPSLKGSKSKPGVILLGRGNSFSLGRSEVILLHSRPFKRSKGNAISSSGENHLDSIQERSNTPPSPPPISRSVSSKVNLHINGWNRTEEDTQPLEEDENVGDGSDGMDADTFARSMHQLWCKAEEVMTANESRVLKVLEEFGIGEQAGGGGDDGGERVSEEEQVWQIVQENYRSQQ